MSSSLSADEYFDSLRIRYEEIASGTNNFASENLIPQGSDSSVKLYKGRLLLSGQLIDVVAHKLDRLDRAAKELQMSYVLHQKGIANIVAVSDDSLDELVIVKKYLVNGSLDKHLSGSTLTWMQRLQICVGVSQALSCLHYNDVMVGNSYIIHGDIKSSKILLDDNWEPKLHGSQFSAIVERHGLYITSEHKPALQYMDPAYETTRGLTNKSDVFSFGVVLFEVLFGQKAEILNNDNWYFPRLARLYYEERKLDELIDSDLQKQMDLETLILFSETAYFCLKEDRQQRPDIKQVVKRLERALALQKKYEESLILKEQSALCIETTPSSHLKGKNLDHLRIPLNDIKLATKNFSETYCIGSGGYGKVYKAELNHFDGQSSFTTVAIKRIFSREDKQGEEGFLAEIEMLCSCKHPNIISLLGFCDEDSEMLLIYEYASNGSLEDYFGNNYNITSLTWIQRIQICLNIANGLKYLHTSTTNKQKIIHRDIKSANILLDDNWMAKIADFGLSKLHGVTQHGSTLMTSTIAGTQVYLDPEYLNTGKLKRASDIYSFGVVMFEILCGTLAYDRIYGENGLPSIVRQRFHEETLKEIVDPRLKEAEENILMLNRGFHQDSLDTFLKIAHQCLAETQAKRPTIEVIIKQLEKALDVQTNGNDNLQISLEDIKLATRNFNDYNCIGEGMFWKLYEGEIQHDNANFSIFAKRWDSKSPQGSRHFLREVEVLSNHKHKNIIVLVGYYCEMDEKIIVYEHMSNGRLDKHLDDAHITWWRRLKICIDIASGLSFLHADNPTDELSTIHRDIKSSNILLDGDWRAKLYNLEFSSKSWAYESIPHITDNAYGSLDYVDPNYTYGFLDIKSDIYSLGVVLMDILCGGLANADGCENHSQSLVPLVKRLYKEGNLDRLVFQGIKDHIVPESLRKFNKIALQCLEEDGDDRPRTRDVVRKLKIALEFQEDHEIWEPKLPTDYKELLQMSMSPEMYGKSKKDLYNILTKGILLQGGKVLFSLGVNGERNEMISAKLWYKNRKSHNWQSVLTSRFQKVAKMLIVSKLKTQIKTRTQFLSRGVNYGVYLVFKFCKPRKVSTTPIYVNLKYKMGNETLHSYFATWRDDEWMMIELWRCFAHNKDVDFKVILESFSRYYCKSNDICFEGIEFREINNEKQNEQVEKSKAVQRELSTDTKEIPMRSQSYDEGEQLFSPSIVNDEKKRHIFTAKEALYDSSNVKCFYSKPLAQSRFKEVIELLGQQVLHIKCKIESQMLSPNTQYVGYLVFKLSENCHGLHCPIILRDLLCWNNKQTEVLYFRSPSPINRHNINRIPENREDGCMEVCVWKGNSNGKFENDCLPLNLKLISYEGTMSGLIVYGLEFRPM